MINKTFKFFAEKHSIDNDKGHYCIIRAMKEIFPVMETIYSTYDFKTHRNLWLGLSTRKIHHEVWAEISTLATKYYNNYAFL